MSIRQSVQINFIEIIFNNIKDQVVKYSLTLI